MPTSTSSRPSKAAPKAKPRPSYALKDCCQADPSKGDKGCIRKADLVYFDIENRKVPKQRCLATPAPKGFTARASCAPYKGCRSRA